MTPTQIKSLRLSRHETQAQFAKTIGTTVTTVARWETGKSKPMPFFVQKMRELAIEKPSSAVSE
jgi:DNA-binding transcriptional regulator YiaG